MSEKALTERYQVNLLKRKVYFQGEEIKIRSKSFELLSLLLDNQNKIISKDQMLSTVWDDVKVDEQVVFQSIKELRKAFTHVEAIQTFPRKGYAWIADVIIIDTSPTGDFKKVDEQMGESKPTHTQKLTSINLTHSIYKILTVLLLIAIFFVWLNAQNNPTSSQLKHQVNGSIIILPLKEHINDRDHKWVRIGAMDQLIQQIPSSNNYGVMQVDDVLDIMKRAQISLTEFNSEDIDKIFVVSGAQLIIEAELTGSTGDYQLVYSLRRQNGIERGALLTPDAYDAIDQLAQIISKSIGAPIPTVKEHSSKLVNQLLAQALDHKITDDFKGAERYLKSLLEIDPENIKAKRILAEVSFYRKNTAQITGIVHSVEGTISTHSDLINLDDFQREYGRLQFWQGLNELQLGHFDKAQLILGQAREKAKKVQDWLYLGYVSEGFGHLFRFTNKLELAKKHYQEAIVHHNIIKCPFGKVNNTLNLAEIAFLQNDVSGAKSYVSNAINLAKKRELIALYKQAELAERKYISAEQFNEG